MCACAPVEVSQICLFAGCVRLVSLSYEQRCMVTCSRRVENPRLLPLCIFVNAAALAGLCACQLKSNMSVYVTA